MKAVLAYSGGLDTSVCVRLLQEKYGCDVVTVTVDVGVARNELKEAEEKAEKLGVVRHVTIDAKEEFVLEYIFRAIKANASYEGYPLSTALARPLIATKVVEVAKKEKADALAHGATGKGNDQFRFEAVFRSLAPEMKIIAPVRELNLTRKKSMEYAQKKAIPVPVEVGKPFSVDENLWGRSIEGGVLEDPSTAPPEEIYHWTRTTEKEPVEIEVEFKKGVPSAVSGDEFSPVKLVERINALAGSHGVGRIDMMEDRILGMKVRENYECPAAVVLLMAHKELEQLVLTREEMKFKAMVENEWSELVYRGLWTDPLRHDLEAFINKTQERVTGNVSLKLYNGSCMVLSRNSPYGLYSESLASFDDTTLDQRSVEGMLRYHALQASLYGRLEKD